MKRQRGIAEGWLYLIGLIALLVALAAAIHAWNSFISGIDKKGYDRGVQETTAGFVKRDNAALAEANARIAALNAQVRAIEQDGQRKLDLIAQQHEKDKANAKAQRDRDVAAARAGSLKLQDPYGATVCAGQGDRSATAETGPGAGGRDGSAGAQLSQQLTEFLYAEADRADEVVDQLSRAQDVIRQDRVTCGSP